MQTTPSLAQHTAEDERGQFDSLLPAARLDRRGFLAGVAAAGFALAVQPVHASTVISTASTGLATGTAAIAVQGGELPVYYARPAAGERLPVVLVVQEIFGVHEHIRDVCRRLAHAGYLAIAPELFFRQGDPTTQPDIPAILQNIVAKVPDAQVMADLDACAAWSASQGGDPARLAITGFCWGGRITWLYAAHKPSVKAGVAWYGRLVGARLDAHPAAPARRRRASCMRRCSGSTAARTRASRSPTSRRCRPRSPPRAAAAPSTSIPTRPTPSTPTTGRATARPRPRTAGSARWSTLPRRSPDRSAHSPPAAATGDRIHGIRRHDGCRVHQARARDPAEHQAADDREHRAEPPPPPSVHATSLTRAGVALPASAVWTALPDQRSIASPGGGDACAAARGAGAPRSGR